MSATVPSERELKLTYALSKQVPELQRGFVIATDFGDLEIPQGRLATAVQSAVRNVLRRELMREEARRRVAQNAIFRETLLTKHECGGIAREE